MLLFHVDSNESCEVHQLKMDIFTLIVLDCFFFFCCVVVVCRNDALLSVFMVGNQK